MTNAPMKKNAPKSAKAAPSADAAPAHDALLDKVANEIDAIFKKYDLTGMAAFNTETLKNTGMLLRMSASWTSLEIVGESEADRKKPTPEQDMNTMRTSWAIVEAMQMCESSIKVRGMGAALRAMKAKGLPAPLMKALKGIQEFCQARKVQVTPDKAKAKAKGKAKAKK